MKRHHRVGAGRTRHASSFANLAERRAWLDGQPDTHENHRQENWPAAKWLKTAKDHKRLAALRIWRSLSDPPQLCANDNDPRWPDGRPLVTQINTEMETYRAEQLIYAHENGMTRWVGNKLVKVWNGYKWSDPDEEFTVPKAANDPKVDAMHFHAEVMPFEAQEDQAKAIDFAHLRAGLGEDICAVLDMAASDSTIREIGEHLGFAGQYAERKGAIAARTAIDWLCTAIRD